MPLHLVIEGAPPGVGLASDSPIDGAPMRQQFQQICTNSQFSLRQALENVLSDELSRFHIIEPGSWVTWDTVASNLRVRRNQTMGAFQPLLFIIIDTGTASPDYDCQIIT